MTTDVFETAARDIAGTRHPAFQSPSTGRLLWPASRDAFIAGAEWARDHLDASPFAVHDDPREPTEEQVRSVMKVCREFYSAPVEVGPQFARAVAAAVLAEGGEGA